MAILEAAWRGLAIKRIRFGRSTILQIEVATISPARSNKSSKGIHWQKKANQKYIQTFKIKADNFLEKSSKFKLDFVSKREWTPILGTTIRAIYPISSPI